MISSEGKNGIRWYAYMLAKAEMPSASNLLSRFSEIPFGESQLKFHIESLQALGASLDVSSGKVKSNKRAHKYKIAAERLLVTKVDLKEVAEMYTRSLAYAEPGSIELSLIYADRSAISFKAMNYEDCLHDIRRSLENNYPDNLRAELYGRGVMCLTALQKSPEEIEEILQDIRNASMEVDPKATGRDEVVESLYHEDPVAAAAPMAPELKPIVDGNNHKILGTTGVTIKYSRKYGKYIAATSYLRPGDAIAVVDRYAHVRSPEQFYRECTHCMKETLTGIPCDHCVNVIYCSTTCRAEAWKDYHEFECPVLGILIDLNMSMFIQLIVKVTLKAVRKAGGVVELKEMLRRIDALTDPRAEGCTGNGVDCSKFACIRSITNRDESRNELENYRRSVIMTFVVYYLATETHLFGKKYPKDLGVFYKNPLLFFIGEFLMKNWEIKRILMTRDATVEPKTAHYMMVAPFMVFCNHSCDSDIVLVRCPTLNKDVAFANRPIKVGERICFTYMDQHYTSVPKAERQQLLREQYLFSCDCMACTQNWPLMENLPINTRLQHVPEAVRKLLSISRKNFHKNQKQAMSKGSKADVKDELVTLLELLHEHCYPSREYIQYQQILKDILQESAMIPDHILFTFASYITDCLKMCISFLTHQ